MILRILLVVQLIFSCLYRHTRPWNFFQLNRDYFNPEKKIFSKQELNELVPDAHRLPQIIDDGEVIPEFPVFAKPEWGQNSHGVCLIHSQEELAHHRAERDAGVEWLLQQAAVEAYEFEIFFIRDVNAPDQTAFLSVTETVNNEGRPLVINGVHNPHCSYHDLTAKLSEEEKVQLWKLTQKIGFFNIGRLGVRADSLQELLRDHFHVIEINAFLPMPLALLDSGHSFFWKYGFIRQAMAETARQAARVKIQDRRYPIFFHSLAAHYKVKS